MRWGDKTTAKVPDYAVRYVYRFALLPARDNVTGGWVWLERYVRCEYWSRIFGEWKVENDVRWWQPVVYDCRKEAP